MLEIIALLAALQMPLADRQEVYCIAQVVYHEARDQSLVGQAAVANVVQNRMARAGKTACQVVFQPGQFSWAADPPPRTEPVAWRQAVEIAGMVYVGLIPDQTKGATHFYDRHRVRPEWVAEFRQTRIIESHRFMRAAK